MEHVWKDLCRSSSAAMMTCYPFEYRRNTEMKQNRKGQIEKTQSKGNQKVSFIVTINFIPVTKHFGYVNFILFLFEY